MRVLMLLALAIHFLLAQAQAATPPASLATPLADPVQLGATGSANLLPRALLLRDDGGDFPASGAALPGWIAAHARVAAVASTGGAYWLVAAVRRTEGDDNWVIAPSNTLIDRIETRIADGAGGFGAPQLTGFRASHDYMLHYGSDLQLPANRTQLVVVRFSSPYFVRAPIFGLVPRAQFRRLVARENIVTVAALGALTAMAIYNFFLFSVTRRRAYLYYALFVVSYALAWALPFNIFADLFDWHEVRLHYVPFFLLPVFSTLFYLHFLELPKVAPRLAAISRLNIVLPLLMLPASFLATDLAPKLITVVVAFYMPLAVLSGVVAWRRGLQPARYFLLAYCCLLAPSVLILLSNLGLPVPISANLPLMLLVGGTADALLLAFALADQIRLLGENMESQVAARTDDLLRANVALTAAKEHAEVVSRHRIDFLSAMSHDIRTPMAGIIGMLKLALREPGVRGRAAEYLRIGLSNGESLLVILNDILDYSKIDAGKMTLEHTRFDLVCLVSDAAAILHSQAGEKGLALRTVFAPGLPAQVMGDPTRLRQILINLLGNAIKFTERGEVLLTVRGGAAGFLFSVEDTGPGIAPQVQARLFQKFEQGDYSATRRYGGTGLGLVICKELAELMGGSISMDSTPGLGSRFDVILPLALPADDEAGPVADLAATLPGAAAAQPLHPRRLRILCAEDVRTNQIIIKALLEAMGHTVVLVEDGAAAVRALAGQDFDLVLMDGRMPLMDGAQATRLIRSGTDEQGKASVRNPRIPIIALTANASEADRQHYLAAGMDGFLPKPVDEAALHQVIAALIKEQSGPATVATAAPAPKISTDEQPGLAPVQGLSEAQMGRIAGAFLAEAPRRLADARAALADGRVQEAVDAFHALKGSAAYLRSQRLARLAGSLEARAGRQRIAADDAELASLAAALDTAVEGVRAATADQPIL